MIKAFGQRDILLELAQLFSSNPICYLLTGSFAVSYYGFPRATHNIDFVIEIEKNGHPLILKVLKKLGKDYFFDSAINNNYLKNTTQFNIFHEPTGVKIDFWIVDSHEFSEIYSRRKIVDFDGIKITVVSSEDLIVTKLLWCQEVFSERHLRDCIGIWQIQKDNLDNKYLSQKIAQNGLEQLYRKVTSRSYN